MGRDLETRELCLSSSKFLDFKVCRIFVSRRHEGKKNVQFDHSSPASLKSRVLKQKRKPEYLKRMFFVSNLKIWGMRKRKRVAKRETEVRKNVKRNISQEWGGSISCEVHSIFSPSSHYLILWTPFSFSFHSVQELWMLDIPEVSPGTNLVVKKKVEWGRKGKREKCQSHTLLSTWITSSIQDGSFEGTKERKGREKERK